MELKKNDACFLFSIGQTDSPASNSDFVYPLEISNICAQVTSLKKSGISIWTLKIFLNWKESPQHN